MNKIDKQWDFFKFEKGESITINATQTTAIISDATDKPSYYDDKYIRTDVSLKTGDIIEYQNNKWIVISQEDKNEKSYKAKMRRSNYKVKVVLDEVLHEFDAIIETVNVSINESKYVDTVAGKITVTITTGLFSNGIDINNRFIKLGYAWKVVGVDRSKIGLNIIHAEKDLISSDDDIDNEIANKSSIAVWSISVADTNRKIELGSDYTYTATILKNATEYSGTNIIWQSSDSNIATVNNGVVHGIAVGFAVISVYMEVNPNVQLNLNIEVSEEVPDIITYKMYKTNLNGTERNYTDFSILQGSTKIFGMERYVNGVIGVNDTYTFVLNSNGVPSANYVYTILNDNSVKIQNKTMSKPKLVLTATSNQSGEAITKNIELNGLW